MLFYAAVVLEQLGFAKNNNNKDPQFYSNCAVVRPRDQRQWPVDTGIVAKSHSRRG